MIFRQRRRNSLLTLRNRWQIRYEERRKKNLLSYMIFESLQTKSSFHREDVRESEVRDYEKRKHCMSLSLSLCMCLIFFNVVVSDKPLIILTNPHPSKKFTQGKLGCFIAAASTDRERSIVIVCQDWSLSTLLYSHSLVFPNTKIHLWLDGNGRYDNHLLFCEWKLRLPGTLSRKNREGLHAPPRLLPAP